MDRLNAIRVAREVARTGGFTAAARVLNISKPSISRVIGDLEADLGVRLFSRSSRRVALTEEGQRFLERAVPLYEELQSLTGEMRAARATPSGHLRITSIVAFGQERIAPILPAFMRANPDVTIELELRNRRVDLIHEQFDIGIRAGNGVGLEDSSLRMRKLMDQRLIFVASPAYIARNGAPESLDQLNEHLIVKQVSGTWGLRNRFRSGNGVVDHALPQRYVVNSPNAALKVLLAGDAMGLTTDYMARAHLDAGRLVRVLPDLVSEPQAICAVFVHRTYMPAKVRACLDFLAANVTG